MDYSSAGLLLSVSIMGESKSQQVELNIFKGLCLSWFIASRFRNGRGKWLADRVKYIMGL